MLEQQSTDLQPNGKPWNKVIIPDTKTSYTIDNTIGDGLSRVWIDYSKFMITVEFENQDDEDLSSARLVEGIYIGEQPSGGSFFYNTGDDIFERYSDLTITNLKVSVGDKWEEIDEMGVSHIYYNWRIDQVRKGGS